MQKAYIKIAPTDFCPTLIMFFVFTALHFGLSLASLLLPETQILNTLKYS